MYEDKRYSHQSFDRQSGVQHDVPHNTQDHNTFSYNKADVRQSFISKVFTIVSVQIGLTFILNLACHLSPTLGAIAVNFASVWVIGTIFFMLALSCFRDLARRVPVNYYLLFGFTACEALALYAGTYFIDPELLLTALFYTAVTVGLLAFFAANSNYDFTSSSFLTYFLVAHLLFNLAGFWLFGGSMLYTYVGTLMFAVYLVIDLQMILGRKEVALGIDEYVFAALSLYTDVIQLFVKILEVLNKQNEKNEKNRRKAYRK